MAGQAGGLPASMSSMTGAQPSMGNPGQANELDLSAILANYRPNMINTQVEQNHPRTQQSHPGHMPSLDSNSAAAAAVAAYGHLGFPSNGMPQGPGNAGRFGGPPPPPGMGMVNGMPHSGPMGIPQIPRSMSGPVWDPMSQMGHNDLMTASMMPGPNKGMPAPMRNHSSRLGMGGYEGDASNSSTAQTPGASSGDDSNNSKRRSNTMPNIAEQMGPAAQLGFAGMGTDGQDGMAGGMAHGSFAQHLQRPTLRHRRSHSGSQVIGPTQGPMAGEGQPMLNKRLSGPSTGFPMAANATGPYAQSLHGGHAASHPPGLGGQVLRGLDIGAGGGNAATDFTKRKGWHNRIVDELLDFVHVLDEDANVLFAASSVNALTGWKLEELRGKSIRQFIHPQDVAAFDREFKRCFQERSEMTMYYRFRKKPQTAADKQRVRDQRAASTVNQINSGSASDGDSSSNQDGQRKSITTFADGTLGEKTDGNEDEDSELLDDSEDTYVMFEVTGHPYFDEDHEAEAKTLTEEAADKGATDPTSPLAQQTATAEHSSPAFKRTPAKPTVKAEVEGVQSTTTEDATTKKPVQCFFCTGRIYPTKNVGMLDSFLELKLENERLRLLLGELSLNDGSTQLGEGSSDGRRSLDEVAYPIDYPHDLDNHRLGSSTQAVQAGQSSQTGTTSPNGLMSAPTSPQTVHLERTMTANTLDGTTANDEESDEDSESGLAPDDPKRKKKKPKQEEGDFVCTDCGRVDSPEWRKGPLGPKTLCNACGLRWAKKIKRSGGDPNAVSKAGAAALKAQGGIKLGPGMAGAALPINLGGPSQSFAGAAGKMDHPQRPPLHAAQTTATGMYGMGGGMGMPPLHHAAASFDSSMASMQAAAAAAAMFTSSPTQMGYGLPQGGGGGHPNGIPHPQQMGHPGPSNGMPPMMHQNSSFMGQPNAGGMAQHGGMGPMPGQMMSQGPGQPHMMPNPMMFAPGPHQQPPPQQQQRQQQQQGGQTGMPNYGHLG